MSEPDDPNPIGPARAREPFDWTRDDQGRPGAYLEIELRGPVVDEAGRVVVPDAVMKGIRVEGYLRQTELDRAIGYAGGCAYCRGLGVPDFGSHETEACPRWTGAHEHALAQHGATLAAAQRRINSALAADREQAVLRLVSQRPSWLPWSPLRSRRAWRRDQLRRSIRVVGSLVVAALIAGAGALLLGLAWL